MKIAILGGGAMGTALANVLAMSHDKPIHLVIRDQSLAEAINQNRVNARYFPTTPLSPRITATTDSRCLKEANIVFLAIPSGVLIETLEAISNALRADAVLVNLSKGLGRGIVTLAESIVQISGRRACSLKGPTFASEMIKNLPSAFTLATDDLYVKEQISEIFSNTQIYLDHSQDIRAVEYASVLKNIYAIAIGIVDAQLNAANPRFLVMTNAFAEMCHAIELLSGNRSIANKYCCYGDFGLTALNDMSRNRTLGLLIGKGFFSGIQSNQSVILEGGRALNSIWSHFLENESQEWFPIMGGLADLFGGRISQQMLLQIMLRPYVEYR